MAELLLWLIWIFIPIAILYSLYSISLRSSQKYSNLPPGPKPLPIVGNMFMLGDKPHQSLARLAKSYGPVMSLKLGQLTTVVISSPELAREVLMKKDHDFCSRPLPDAMRVLNHCDASLVWLPANQRWKNLRIICSTQLFVSQRLDYNTGLRQKKAQELVEYLRERGAAGEAVDVGVTAFMTSLNLLSNTLFSIDMVDPNSDSAQHFRDLIWAIMEDVGNPNISDFFPFLSVLDLQGNRRRNEGHFKRLHRIFDELIDQRLDAMKDHSAIINQDFLDALLNCFVDDECEGGDKERMDRHAIKSLLVDVFVAGTDTTSHTVEWAMAELLHNPESMSKARAELVEAFNKQPKVEESDILKLPYLQAVVKETFRLHPPVPFLVPRRTETDTELCGYVIPKNTRVLVNAWAIGRSENVWKDPDVFRPERFLEMEVDYKGRHFELIPFGAGRRICPGLPLAFRMVHLMLASLVRTFKWELADGMKAEDMDLSDKFGFTVGLAKPIRAIPIPDELAVRAIPILDE